MTDTQCELSLEPSEEHPRANPSLGPALCVTQQTRLDREKRCLCEVLTNSDLFQGLLSYFASSNLGLTWYLLSTELSLAWGLDSPASRHRTGRPGPGPGWPGLLGYITSQSTLHREHVFVLKEVLQKPRNKGRHGGNSRAINCHNILTTALILQSSVL